ncbi:MAG: Fur family transcriptional regulator [Cyanobacteria bacterium J06627_28]
MSLNTAEIIETLKAKKLRVTPQRFAVYANLLGREDHPTAEQLLKDLNKDVPTASQATLYSSLQALRNAGLIRDVRIEEGVCRYDANVGLHHHFRCNSCGAIEDVAWENFQQVDAEQLRPGLTVESYEVTIRGVCDRCQ